MSECKRERDRKMKPEQRSIFNRFVKGVEQKANEIQAKKNIKDMEK